MNCVMSWIVMFVSYLHLVFVTVAIKLCKTGYRSCSTHTVKVQ
jgi:hypothetical protein